MYFLLIYLLESSTSGDHHSMTIVIERGWAICRTCHVVVGDGGRAFLQANPSASTTSTATAHAESPTIIWSHLETPWGARVWLIFYILLGVTELWETILQPNTGSKALTDSNHLDTDGIYEKYYSCFTLSLYSDTEPMRNEQLWTLQYSSDIAS